METKWDQTWHLLQRAVARGKARKQAKPIPRIGIDEKAFSKSQSYLTLQYDLDNSTVKRLAMATIRKAERFVSPSFLKNNAIR